MHEYSWLGVHLGRFGGVWHLADVRLVETAVPGLFRVNETWHLVVQGTRPSNQERPTAEDDDDDE